MKIGIVGCGYVSDHYMDSLPNHPHLTLLGVADRNLARAKTISEKYGTRVYESAEALINDPEVQLVVNLTDPHNHYEISKAGLLAGKHVYSEKPLSPSLDEAKELMELARSKGLLLSSAPCSILSETAQTMWKAVKEGAVGKVRLVYAELDDNPIYLMRPEGWSNESGAPWPYLNEYEVGCTLEHAGYYLTWLAAMFGPAKSITSFSHCTVPDKTDIPLNPPDTPDFSVACILFHSGVTARLTCSIVGPYDHRLRIIGDQGVLSTPECWHYFSPVHLERFSQLTLNARKARSVRDSSFWQAFFGINGSRLPLIRRQESFIGQLWRELKSRKRSLIRSLIRTVSRRQLVRMDFMRGVAEMANAVRENRRCQIPDDFVLHVNELTLAMQNAGPEGRPYEVTTTFEPLQPAPETLQSGGSLATAKPGILRRLIDHAIAKLHKH